MPDSNLPCLCVNGNDAAVAVTSVQDCPLHGNEGRYPPDVVMTETTVPDSDLPPEAITAAIAAEAAIWDNDEDLTVRSSQLGEFMVRRILEAALPAIRARYEAECAAVVLRAILGERERIRRRLTADAATLRAAGRVASADALQRHASMLEGGGAT